MRRLRFESAQVGTPKGVAGLSKIFHRFVQSGLSIFLFSRGSIAFLSATVCCGKSDHQTVSTKVEWSQLTTRKVVPYEARKARAQAGYDAKDTRDPRVSVGREIPCSLPKQADRTQQLLRIPSGTLLP